MRKNAICSFYEGSQAGRGFGSGACRGIRLRPRNIQKCLVCSLYRISQNLLCCFKLLAYLKRPKTVAKLNRWKKWCSLYTHSDNFRLEQRSQPFVVWKKPPFLHCEMQENHFGDEFQRLFATTLCQTCSYWHWRINWAHLRSTVAAFHSHTFTLW